MPFHLALTLPNQLNLFGCQNIFYKAKNHKIIKKDILIKKSSTFPLASKFAGSTVFALLKEKVFGKFCCGGPCFCTFSKGFEEFMFEEKLVRFWFGMEKAEAKS